MSDGEREGGPAAAGADVVVTGLGAITAYGCGSEALWRGVCAGESALGMAPQGCDDGEPFAVGVVDDAVIPSPPVRDVLAADRCTRLALAALDEALGDAALGSDRVAPERLGIAYASALGGMGTQEGGFARYFGSGVRRVAPDVFLNGMSAVALHVLARRSGANGPSILASGACAASTHALWAALQWLRQDLVDAAVVIGAETPLTPAHFSAWRSMRVMSPEPCRPFSSARRGMSLGEGAAVLVLERAAFARARGARRYCRLAGVGLATDTTHALHPAAEPTVAAMRAALRDAGVTPEQLSYVNAHATGTLVGDRVEGAAIRALCGAHADRVAVSSTKGGHGHLLGAAAMVEAVVTARAVHAAMLPPSVLASPVDAACGVAVVESAREGAVDVAVSNSLAFGGLMGAIVLGQVSS